VSTPPPPPPRAPPPPSDGSVEFFDNTTGAFLGTVAVTDGLAALQVTFSAFTAGDTIYATYLPTSGTLAPSSGRVTQVIANATTTSLTGPASTPVYGQTVTFTATDTATATDTGMPMGTVEFFDGSTVLATVPLAVVNGVDEATYSTSALPLGSPTISAGDTNGNGNFTVSSSSLVQTVNATAGVYVAGTTLYLIGANTSDFGPISPWGSKLDGSTGLAVLATLDNKLHLVATQPFSAIEIIGFGGNDTFQLLPTLTLPTTVVEGNGNNFIALANGNDTVTLGTGNDDRL
jgi:hypothetical protein